VSYLRLVSRKTEYAAVWKLECMVNGLCKLAWRLLIVLIATYNKYSSSIPTHYKAFFQPYNTQVLSLDFLLEHGTDTPELLLQDLLALQELKLDWLDDHYANETVTAVAHASRDCHAPCANYIYQELRSTCWTAFLVLPIMYGPTLNLSRSM